MKSDMVMKTGGFFCKCLFLFFSLSFLFNLNDNDNSLVFVLFFFFWGKCRGPNWLSKSFLRVLSVYLVVEFHKKKCCITRATSRTQKNNKVQTINLHYAVYNILFVLKIRNIPKTACNAVYAKVVVKPRKPGFTAFIYFCDR